MSESPGKSTDGEWSAGQLSSVLFVCNHNVIRSPMAEAITRSLFPRTIFTASAGVRTGDIDPFVAAVMAEWELDLSDHEPQTLEELDEGYFDLIVTLSPTAHHVALERAHIDAADIVYWPSADPTVVQGSRETVLAAYRDVRDRLKADILQALSPDAKKSGSTS